MKWSRNGLICGLLVAITLAAYWPLFRNDFIRLDDHDYVVENPHVLGGLTLANLKWAFTSAHSSNWHPLTWISHQLDVQLFGLRPAWHHAVSLLFHIVNALLLFMVLRKMTSCVWRSAMVAALFAVHPLHVESVAWVAERKDVLSTFFFLLTLWAYAVYVRSPKSEVQSLRPEDQDLPQSVSRITHHASRFTFHVSRFYLLALLFFACGLMSKPMLVTTPFVLLLLDFWPLQRFAFKNQSRPNKSLGVGSPNTNNLISSGKSKIKNLLVEKIPFFALCAASSVVTFLVQQAGHSTSTMEGLPLEPRLTNAILSYVKYLGKTFWPVDLAVFYPHPGNRGPAGEAPDWQVAIAVLLLVAISVSVVFRLKREPWLATGWFWFLGTLVPVIGIVQVGGQEIADRYTYIPLIGIFIAFVWWAADFVADRRFGVPALKLAGVLAVATFAIASQRQANFWRSTQTLFEHALAVTQNNGVAHYILGVDYYSQGKTALAAGQFRAAIEADPTLAAAYYSLGCLLAAEGKTDEAIQQYDAALRARPGHVLSLNGLGAAYWRLGRREEAVAEYQEALRIKSDFADAHYNLGVALSAEGNVEEAAAHFGEAVRLKSDNAEKLSAWAGSLVKQGKLAEAETCCRVLARLRPADAEVHNNFGVVLRLEGKRDEARAQFEESLRLKPAQADPLFGVGTILLEQGRIAEAETNLAEAVRLKPGYVDAWAGLGRARVLEGKFDDAAREFEQAARLRPDSATYYELATVRVMQGNARAAVTNYEEAVHLNPDSLPALNDLAWLLATDSHADLRNGTEAMRLAEHARDLSGGKTARFWGTLDAAYAEAARWNDATHAAQKASELALAAGETNLAAAAEKRLDLYRQQKPYRQGN